MKENQLWNLSRAESSGLLDCENKNSKNWAVSIVAQQKRIGLVSMPLSHNGNSCTIFLIPVKDNARMEINCFHKDIFLRQVGDTETQNGCEYDFLI